MSWPPWDEFLTSPGAGGLGALVAAIIIGWVTLRSSIHRRLDAAETAAQKDAQAAQIRSHQEQERWWGRFTWLVELPATSLPFEGRLAMIAELKAQADLMEASDLVAIVDAYIRHLDTAARNEGQ